MWWALAANILKWNIFLTVCLNPLAGNWFLNCTFLPKCLSNWIPPEFLRTGNNLSVPRSIPHFCFLFWWSAFLPEPGDILLFAEHNCFFRQKGCSFCVLSPDYLCSVHLYSSTSCLLCFVQPYIQHCHDGIPLCHIIYQCHLTTNSLAGVFIGQKNVSS